MIMSLVSKVPLGKFNHLNHRQLRRSQRGLVEGNSQTNCLLLKKFMTLAGLVCWCKTRFLRNNISNKIVVDETT